MPVGREKRAIAGDELRMGSWLRLEFAAPIEECDLVQQAEPRLVTVGLPAAATLVMSRILDQIQWHGCCNYAQA